MVTAINSRKPNPGTKEAITLGCKCPVIDNHYGKGWDGQGKEFIYNMECEIHTSEIKISDKGLEIKQ